jgi:hypothetical protein
MDENLCRFRAIFDSTLNRYPEFFIFLKELSTIKKPMEEKPSLKKAKKEIK